MSLVSYQPLECQSGQIPNCDMLVAYARYNIKSSNVNDAQNQFSLTIFTCVIMCFGSIILSKDTDQIVVYPINNLVSIIKLLADDPLKQPEEPVFSIADLNQNHDSIKTVEL